MVNFLTDLIGVSYTDNPLLFTLCFLLVVWFIYQLFSLVYLMFGGGKR